MKSMLCRLLLIQILVMLMPVLLFASEKESMKQMEEYTLVNINTASDTTLRSLPGVGESNSLRIIAARPYTNKEQLKSKKIIRDVVYRRIKHLITVSRGND